MAASPSLAGESARFLPPFVTIFRSGRTRWNRSQAFLKYLDACQIDCYKILRQYVTFKEIWKSALIDGQFCFPLKKTTSSSK